MIKPAGRISYKTNYNPHHKTQNFKRQMPSSHRSNKTTNTTILMPVMIKKSANDDPCAIKVHHSKGPAYIMKRNVMKPLTQLGRSFINGGQIIGLTLILTVISGVFMWILVSTGFHKPRISSTELKGRTDRYSIISITTVDT